MNDVTQLLEAAQRGDRQAAAELLPRVYDELRQLAAARLAREQVGQTLTATALVHEAYLRLVASPGREPGEVRFDGRGHFFAAAAEAIRRILVEQARRRQAARHGGGQRRADLDPDQLAAPAPDDELLALHEALDRLAAAHQAALFRRPDRRRGRRGPGPVAQHRRPPLGLRPRLASAGHVRTRVRNSGLRTAKVVRLQQLTTLPDPVFAIGQ